LGEHYEYVKGKHDSQEAIAEQQWKCTKCNDLINLDAAATTALNCESGNVYCGQPGYETILQPKT
jgi:hypothetical protein